MGCGGKCLLLLSIFIVAVAYYLYKPLPDILANGEEPWQIRKNLAIIKFAGDLSWLASKIGLDKNGFFRVLMSSKVQQKDYEGMDVTDTELGGVAVRIYRPHGLATPAPALVFYHGGGWMWGSIDSHDCVTSALAKRTPAVVVSVEYRLAPENPYPAPFNDCLDATIAFMAAAADEYDVDPKRIGIAGDSAGGNLAAAVALKLRDMAAAAAAPDHSIPPMLQPKLQMLIYPVLQGFDLNLPSLIENDSKLYGSPRGLARAILSYMGVVEEDVKEKIVEAMVENRHLSKESKLSYGGCVSTDLYLPKRFRGDYEQHTQNLDIDGDQEIDQRIRERLFDPSFLPLMAKDLSNLPKAYVMSCEFDTLRDEDIMYAKRLEEAGVEVTWVHYDDGFHSIMSFVCPPTTLKLGLRLQDDMVTYLQNNL